MNQCQNVCGRTVPEGYRLCPACQACENQRVQLVRAGLEANYDQLRVENERLRSIYADASEALLYITAYVRGETMQEPYPEAGQYAELDTVRAEVDKLRDENKKMRKHFRQPTHGPCCTCQRCGQYYDDCRCSLDDVADELQAANLTIEASDALLAEARAELAAVRAVEEAVGTTISPTWMHPCLKKAMDNYRTRWQSGEKEDEA